MSMCAHFDKHVKWKAFKSKKLSTVGEYSDICIYQWLVIGRLYIHFLSVDVSNSTIVEATCCKNYS